MFRLATAGLLATLALGVAGVVVGCGSESGGNNANPGSGDQSSTASIPAPFVTKNTTRIGSGDPAVDAAAVTGTVFPPLPHAGRPQAVVLVDTKEWQAAVAGAELMSSPLRAPMLFASGGELPAATREVLERVNPQGASSLNGAKLIALGAVPLPADLKSHAIRFADPYTAAAAIDHLHAVVTGKMSTNVVIASGEAPAFAMPAAGWAAKSGDPVLFVKRRSVPLPTLEALIRHRRPHIYILGPPNVIDATVVQQLQQYGAVTRIGASTPVGNAIAFARFHDQNFGWGVTDPGHGFVFAPQSRVLDAAAAAPLSASGSYGPLLLLQEGQPLPASLLSYLLDVRPGYSQDPVRGVYNHGWIVGSEQLIPAVVQSQLDTLLEIQPVNQRISR